MTNIVQAIAKEAAGTTKPTVQDTFVCRFTTTVADKMAPQLMAA